MKEKQIGIGVYYSNISLAPRRKAIISIYIYICIEAISIIFKCQTFFVVIYDKFCKKQGRNNFSLQQIFAFPYPIISNYCQFPSVPRMSDIGAAHQTRHGQSIYQNHPVRKIQDSIKKLQYNAFDFSLS